MIEYVSAIAGIAEKRAKFLSSAFKSAKTMVANTTEKLLDKLSVFPVDMSMSWLRDDVKKKLAVPGTVQVAVGEIRKMTELFPSVPEWEKLQNEGVTHMIASVDANGDVLSVDLIRDTSLYGHKDVSELINRTGEGMVVINM